MEKRSDTCQISTDIQWEYAGDGIVRQIMGYDEHLMMVKVKFNQGAIGTLHQHPHTQSTYVASGCFEVTILNYISYLRVLFRLTIRTNHPM